MLCLPTDLRAGDVILDPQGGDAERDANEGPLRSAPVVGLAVRHGFVRVWVGHASTLVLRPDTVLTVERAS